MKKVTKFFMAALLAGMCSFGYAQTYEWQKPMQPTETYKGTITKRYLAGGVMYSKGKVVVDTRTSYTGTQLYSKLLADAQNEYSTNVIIRQFTSSVNEKENYNEEGDDIICNRAYYVSATVCTPASAAQKPNATARPSSQTADPLTQALNKALRNVREGSRLAIEVSVPYSMDRNNFKDQLIDVLLDAGYKVVAKEYLEKLYQEQQAQQSGIYNDRTTVQENNFSAVGYYLNVKLTETSVRVQVVNVSTGEYEGNATVNF